jgi:hypothetical protein
MFGDRTSEGTNRSVVVSATDQDRTDRLRAITAAVQHREAIQRLRAELKLADTVDRVGWFVAEMNRVGDDYEAWLRAETVRTRAQDEQRSAQMSNAGFI